MKNLDGATPLEEREEGSLPHIRSLAGQAGFIMVTKDMGNNVFRLESAEIIPREDALAARNLLGRTPLPYPMPDHIWDLVREAVLSMGYDITGTQQWMASGVARAIGDATIEVLIWSNNDE